MVFYYFRDIGFVFLFLYFLFCGFVVYFTRGYGGCDSRGWESVCIVIYFFFIVILE